MSFPLVRPEWAACEPAASRINLHLGPVLLGHLQESVPWGARGSAVEASAMAWIDHGDVDAGGDWYGTRGGRLTVELGGREAEAVAATARHLGMSAAEILRRSIAWMLGVECWTPCAQVREVVLFALSQRRYGADPLDIINGPTLSLAGRRDALRWMRIVEERRRG